MPKQVGNQLAKVDLKFIAISYFLSHSANCNLLIFVFVSREHGRSFRWGGGGYIVMHNHLKIYYFHYLSGMLED